jgi:hypothetical protein
MCSQNRSSFFPQMSHLVSTVGCVPLRASRLWLSALSALAVGAVAAPVSAFAATGGGAEQRPGSIELAMADGSHVGSVHSSRQGKLAPAILTLARKGTKPRNDPSEAGSGDAENAQGRKGKAGDDKDTGTKSTGSKSGDSLDSLMNNVVTENKAGKDKKQNKEMDAILKDVQKSEPAPPPKKEAPAAAPPLSPAEISAAMAQLKARGNACAQRSGRGGTAELKITVSKEGKVTEVKVAGKIAATPTAACIEQAAKALSFRPNAGLRFDYRMDVH